MYKYDAFIDCRVVLYHFIYLVFVPKKLILSILATSSYLTYKYDTRNYLLIIENVDYFATCYLKKKNDVGIYID